MTKIIVPVLVSFIIIAILFFYWLTHRYTIVDKDKSNNYYYNFFKTEIHNVPMGNWFELGDTALPDLDVNNFTILSPLHIRDSKTVYFEGTKITNADLATFTIIGDEKFNSRKFAKDKNHLYYGANSFENIDLNSYKIDYQDNEYIISDKKNTYSLNLIFDRNAGIIKCLPKNYVRCSYNSSYGKDDNTLYFKEEAIEGSSGKKFQNLNSLGAELVSTESGVYYDKYKLSNIDISTFSILENSYCFKDKNGIYCNVEEIIDKKNLDGSYTIKGYRAIKLDVDMATFQLFDGPVYPDNQKGQGFYAKDKNGIYCIYPFTKVKEVDIATFLNDGSRYAKDKNHTYLDGKVYQE
jgi:hypothetical protein